MRTVACYSCLSSSKLVLCLQVIEVKDTSIPFMPRVEVIDARSGAHLGHVSSSMICCYFPSMHELKCHYNPVFMQVFTDGPKPTGKRLLYECCSAEVHTRRRRFAGRGKIQRKVDSVSGEAMELVH